MFFHKRRTEAFRIIFHKIAIRSFRQEADGNSVTNAMADGLWHTFFGNYGSGFDDMRASRQLFSPEVICISRTFSDRMNSYDIFADPLLRGFSSQPQLQKGQGYHKFGFQVHTESSALVLRTRSLRESWGNHSVHMNVYFYLLFTAAIL